MAYIQKNNPIPRTGCGRRRAEQMNNPFDKANPKTLKKIVGELNKASKTHANQADRISAMLKKSPMQKSGTKDACYHKVKARHDVFPSAYASGQIVQCRKVGAANWGNKKKK